MSVSGNQFYGKYRGQVVDNRDPEMMGRLTVKAIDILDEKVLGWAMPCVPYAGAGVGLFLLPPIGASVWVEFEHGDPEYPIWSGCYWAAKGEAPEPSAAPEKKVLKTDAGIVTLDDTPGAGGISIETAAGMKISITTSGIEISDGQGGSIKLSGPRVSVNDGALEVI
jgi:uncharacterized protein involved in type VI secretion and phage assembly